MAYDITAVVAHLGVLDHVVQDPGVPVVTREQGFGLVPLTKEVLVSLGTNRRNVGGVLAEWSRFGHVAYINAEIFAGVGGQDAKVWLNGEVIFDEATDGSGAISRALRRIGVASPPGGRDEFDHLGLGICRSTEKWVKHADPRPRFATD
ncbi:hypothetical protein [Embleya sp. NBC_00896]|uniref:hypothetical protein n=1 Tax=Embleya sp. NBC_00896 TaxID=2975961 RepID=UPI00386EBF61|nr:hypothetical protein OG928_16370 [Embleya sp. NBC_00896]